MSTEDRFRDSSGERECFISMVVSLLDVTTATQQFTVSGYVNAIWQVIPDFEQQEATNKIYPTKKMEAEGMLSVKDQLAELNSAGKWEEMDAGVRTRICSYRRSTMDAIRTPRSDLGP